MKRGGLRSPARWEIRDDDAGKPGAPLCFKSLLQLHRPLGNALSIAEHAQGK